MPYIETETVKAVRQELKKALPEYKLSVTRRHHSTLCVNVMAGPAALEGTRINPYYYERDLQGSPEALEVIGKIMNTIKAIAPQRTLYEDGDYGNIPNHYVNVSVGKWDKPYEQR